MRAPVPVLHLCVISGGEHSYQRALRMRTAGESMCACPPKATASCPACSAAVVASGPTCVARRGGVDTRPRPPPHPPAPPPALLVNQQRLHPLRHGAQPLHLRRGVKMLTEPEDALSAHRESDLASYSLAPQT